jgi:NAD-dependent dihydropyrimidine dehydrogenase PreA subunit
MKIKRKIIEIDEELCDGCGQCVPSCAEGALQIIDGKARMVAEKYCDGLGACLGDCPTGALKIIEREAEEFDEDAVEAYLEVLEAETPAAAALAGGGCPSSTVQIFSTPAGGGAVTPQTAGTDTASALSHWPIQIRLIPPHAPFLKGADLLMMADCTAVSYPAIHQELIPGRVVMLGCPKFDDVEDYIARFTAIFKQAGIKSITNVIMEVPCCSALPMIVKKAQEAAGTDIPVREIVIGTKGQILSDN